MKTYQPKEKEVKREWHVIDAKEEVLGRIATKIAGLLMGKQKTVFSKHMDMGDFVVVLNSEKVKLTGRKEDKKLYRSHSGYPGGFKEVTAKKLREINPVKLIEHAVYGMLPANRLRKVRMLRLKLVVGEKNPFTTKLKEDK